MKKAIKLLIVAVMIPALAGVIVAATTYVGQVVQDVNQKNIGGTAISTGSGTTDAGTQRVTLPTDQAPIPVTGSFSSTGPIKVIDGAGATRDVGYQVGGSSVPVSIQNPSLAVTQSGTWNVNAAQSGSWSVSIAAGANQIGTVSGSSVTAFQGGAPWSQNLTQVGGSALTLGQKTMANSVPVTLASDQTALAVSGTLTHKPLQIPTVNQSSQTVTTSSTQLFAANANRYGIECVSLCTNNKPVFCSFGSSAATSDAIYIEACSSWQPPAGLSPTAAFNCISATTSQVIRCTEYQTP